MSVCGISGSAVAASRMVQIQLQSCVNLFEAAIDCIVTYQIVDRLPAFPMSKNDFEFPRNIKLADPCFHIPSEIDILIGADLFWQLLCIGQIRATSTHPTLQKTRLGWVLAGRVGGVLCPTRSVQSFFTRVTNEQLNEQLLKFWQMEGIREDSNYYTNDEIICKQHFSKNVTRNLEGRYVVKLSFREEVKQKIGDSRDITLKRFYGIEKRLNRDSILKSQYLQFMNEYIMLGHMTLVDDSNSDDKLHTCYLPHHCVFKINDQNSKIRVVFDASSKTSSNVSLNDALFVDLVIQQELIRILMRFRMFRYVLVADIIKMYRQILVHPSDSCFQRILWRENPAENVKAYELKTVTYGTSPASYLATKCLAHLAEQAVEQYLVGSTIVSRDFYMDDLLTGGDKINDIPGAQV